MMNTKILQAQYTVGGGKYQQLSLPIELTNLIPEEDAVRQCSAELEELNYRKLYEAYSPIGRKSAAEPRILFKVMVYGYMNGIYSSRKLERACRRDINFMWLLQGEPVPDHNTIARFRTGKLGAAVEDLFYQYVQRLETLCETDHEVVFVDGSKLESRANKYSFVWRKSTEKQLAKVKEQVRQAFLEHGVKGSVTLGKLNRLVRELAGQCEENGIEFVYGKGRHKTPEQREHEKLNNLLCRWQGYSQKLRTMGKGRNSYSKTDPDATFMHMKEDHMRNAQLKPGYNVQLAVNSEYITGVGIFPNRTDSGTLVPFLDTLKEKHGQKYKAVTADAGYESLENYLYLQENEQLSFLKPVNYERQKSRSFKKQIGRRENMRYLAEEDAYLCHEGRKLCFSLDKRETTATGFEKTISIYRCEDCSACPSRTLCTKAKPENNKQLQVCKDLLPLRDASLRNITSPEGILYRINRSIQVEGAFGVLKYDRGFTRFLTRGRAKVEIEMLLLCMAFNLNKLHAKTQAGRLASHLFTPKKE